MEFKDKVLEILHDTGIYIDDVNEDYKLKDLIEDSLSFISFFIEIEDQYNVEFPESFFNENTLELSLKEIQEIIEILSCGGVVDERKYICF